jgi:hypothetical protein
MENKNNSRAEISPEPEELEKKQTLRSPKRRYKKTKIALIILSILLVIFVLIGYLSSRPVVAAYYAALSGKKNLETAQKNIEAQNFSAAALAIKQAENDFKLAQDDLNKISWIRFIPYIGRQYKAADHLLSAGILISKSLASVSETVIEVVEPIKDGEVSFNELNTEQKREILKNLHQSTPSFQLALSNVSLAEVEIEKVPKNHLVKQIKEAIDIISEQLPTLKDILEGAILATRHLPELAGYPQEQYYLFLFQNNAELRPGGGFIGSYGIIKIKDGELAEIKIDDTYNLDDKSGIKVEMPWQIQVLLSPGIPSWYFRDSAWTPDYPTNAEKAEWFYHEEGGKESFNGVVAITPTFIEYLMEITGPVRIAEHPKEFNSNNVTDLIQYHVERRFVEIGLPEEFRKNIIGELANILLAKLFSLPREKWDDLFKVLEKSINEKHFLLYFHNSEIEKFLEERKWAGKVEETPKDGDYLMIVDSNMASRKTDAFMERVWDYKVDFTNDAPKVKLDLNYKNTALGFSWRTTRYRSWTRVYAPLGSRLLNVLGNEKELRYYNDLNTNYEVTEELGKNAFGTFLIIEPGERKTITLEYELPGKSSNYLKNGYNFLAQKQIGTIKPQLKISTQFPQNTFIVSVEGEGEINIEEGKTEINSDLMADRLFKFNTKLVK